MAKDFFISQLLKLKSVFKSDAEAMQALELLTAKIDQSAAENWTGMMATERKKVSKLSKDNFELPPELKAHNPFGIERFAIFSDGACRGNPGPGAWANVCQNGKGEVLFESSGLDIPTTNNRMELEAAIQGLVALKEHVSKNALKGPFEIHLYSDSKYVLEGLEKWVAGWKARGWKKADNKVPENVEIWMRFDQVAQGEFRPICHWVKGHNGHPQNEYCDALANKALDESGFNN